MKGKRYSEEQIVGILAEVDKGEKPVSEICRSHGVSDQSYYRWRKKYGGMDTADVRRLKGLEKENSHLKRMLAERDLEIDAMKAVLSKNW